MTDDVKILNSKEAIPANTSPTGVVYKAFRDGEAPLWTLYAIREDDLGKVWPDKVKRQPIVGTFTSEQRAYEALRRYLCNLWDESDSESARLQAQRDLKNGKTVKIAA